MQGDDLYRWWNSNATFNNKHLGELYMHLLTT